LMGDAAHTAHFSIGSGTKLAMEDAIALRDELLGARETDAALAAYEARRRPEVEALQAAAQASLEWFEGTERYARMAPVQFTYSLMTRSLRVSHASVAKRDPHLARGVEQLLAASAGIAGPPPPPTALPFLLGDRRARSRIVVHSTDAAVHARATLAREGDAGAAPGASAVAMSAGDAHAGAAVGAAAAQLARRIASLESAAADGAGIVVAAGFAIDAGMPSERGLAREPEAPEVTGAPALGDPRGWSAAVKRVHDQRALIAARIEVGARGPEAIAAAVERAALAGFDVILLDAGADAEATEALPATIAMARTVWRPGGWIAAVVHDRPATRAAVIGHAAQLVRAGADLLWVSTPNDSPPAHGARLPAAPLADRLRNELGVATAIECGEALLADLDAAIAAGRADLVVVGRVPEGARSAP
jgi:anthraniloyl-CoA monooxygenase